MEPNELDLKKPLLPDNLIFPAQIITGNLEDYSNLKKIIEKTSESKPLTATDRSKLRNELMKMKEDLLAKQLLYQDQFDQLKDWMKEAFEVESPQILLDHQAAIKEAEMIAEETYNQGNSKQHQRIRTMIANSNEAQKEPENEPDGEDDDNNDEEGEEEKSVGKTLSKNMSGKGGNARSGGLGQGQKDLSAIKPKIANQIPINVFWNYVEPFFKPIDEDDLKYLDDPSHVMDVAPFVIPPLGLHYEKIWYEQYGYVVPSAGGFGHDNNKRSSRHLDVNGKSQIHLRDRLLSALLDKEADESTFSLEGEFGDEDVVMMDAGSVSVGASTEFGGNSSSSASVPLDDRLKKSLNELGFTDLVSSRDYQEDDEICVEMRSVQRQLREQIVINQYRKKRLAEFIRSRLASQEFYSLIGDLDKQIDSVFQKRIKNAKKKKTGTAAKGGNDSGSQTPNTVADIPIEALQCLQNRRKLLDSFTEIVPDRIESICPSKHVDFDAQVESEIMDSARKGSRWLPLPEIPLKQPLTSSQPAFPNSR